MDLPSFPEIAVRVRRVLSDPKSSVEQVVRVVGSEPALRGAAAADCEFRIAEPQRPASTTCAPPSIGSATTWCAAPRSRFPWRRFARATSWPAWSTTSTIFGSAARRWRLSRMCSRGIPTRVNPDEAMLTGMMHGIGKLYVFTRVDRSSGIVRQRYDAESDHRRMACVDRPAILENWNFSEPMARAVGEAGRLQPQRGRPGGFGRCHCRCDSHGFARRGFRVSTSR